LVAPGKRTKRVPPGVRNATTKQDATANVCRNENDLCAAIKRLDRINTKSVNKNLDESNGLGMTDLCHHFVV